MAAVFAALMAGCGDGIFGAPAAPPAPPTPAGSPGPAGPGPDLGAAASYGMASTAGVTNTGVTVINGDVVLANPTVTCNAVAVPGGAGTAGFGLCGGAPPTLNGSVTTPSVPDAVTANNVKAAMNAAFLSITPPAGPPAAGSRGGATNLPAGTTLGAPTGSPLVLNDNLFVPGIYQSLTSILITGDLTLDAQGNSSAVFIFQSSSAVGTAANARILLVNGAKASNVYWQAASSATLLANTVWEGNILAAADITMNTGATSCGRLWSGAWVGGSGAFVFNANVVSVPGSPSAPVGCQ
ncbi:MAG TPA: ice-binding family protein [Steroidobacteraceae bacterium]|nr:ice-binding family protein [Steroidobacteraceae bacterium]